VTSSLLHKTYKHTQQTGDIFEGTTRH